MTPGCRRRADLTAAAFDELGFSGMSLTRYFMEIGLRYIAVAFPAVAVGYVLQRKFAAK